MTNDFIRELELLLNERKLNKDNSNSYVSSLHKKGIDSILKKIGEESSEVVMAVKDLQYQPADKDAQHNLVHETADLLFHLLVMLSAHNVEFADIVAELQSRHNNSK